MAEELKGEVIEVNGDEATVKVFFTACSSCKMKSSCKSVVLKIKNKGYIQGQIVDIPTVKGEGKTVVLAFALFGLPLLLILISIALTTKVIKGDIGILIGFLIGITLSLITLRLLNNKYGSVITKEAEVISGDEHLYT